MIQIEGNSILLILVLFPIVGAFLSYIIGRFHKTARDIVAGIIAIAEFLATAVLFSLVFRGESFFFRLASFGVNGLYFKLDGFRALYCLIAGFMWMGVVIFSREYMAHHRNRNRYYFFLLITLGATIGVFLSADLMTTFVFFEIMSLASYVWVVQEETKEAIRAGETYLGIAIISGLVLLMGLFLLYSQTKTLAIDDLLFACKQVEDKKLIYISGFCMLFGFGAKAGMFPLHIWLPKAHPVAPAPASALLSGILTKAGVFGILVISSNIFLHDAQWGKVVLFLGTVTMVLGAVIALFSVNLKRTLACSSMSQIGFILVGVGMMGILSEENMLAVRGTILHMVNHSCIKLVLFLAAGVVFMNLHELDLNKIRGFGKNKPLLKIVFLSGALGIGGIPFFNGYISKSLLHEGIAEGIHFASTTSDAQAFRLIEILFLLSGGFTIAYMTKLFVAIFIEKNENQKAMDASNKNYMGKTCSIVLIISSIVLLLLGMFPYFVTDKLADMGEGFLKSEGLTEAVSYFNLENLKGALISITIGAILYFGVVRVFLMKKNERGVKVYITPSTQIDLEEHVYRPVLTLLFPDIFAALCRIFDRFVDTIVFWLRKTIYRHTRPKKVFDATKEAYIIGTILNDIAFVLNKTIFRKHPIKKSFVGLVEVGEKTAGQTGRLVTRSISFGLLLFSIGLLITLLYLLFWV